MAREVSFLLPIMLALAGVGGFLLARRALRPIDDITRTARAIDASDLSRRIGYDGTNDEVGRLAHTFDHMLDRLQASFERERCFTSDAAHELRTPLTALKGQLGVTLSKKRQPEEYADTLRDMEQQVDRLIRLSNDLLFMARLEQCQRHDPPEEIRVSDLLAALADQVQPLAADKAIALDDHLSPGLDVLGREDLLIRLFTNLLDNAIKYTPSGGRVMLRAWQEDGYVHVDVSDTGPGIAPEHLPHLFERFYRVEGSRVRVQDGGLLVGEEGTPVYGGAGLGLAIAQEIARGHGGSLTVRSTPGAGSTFKVWLPAAARARS
jgi:signal transduction histidine kinase